MLFKGSKNIRVGWNIIEITEDDYVLKPKDESQLENVRVNFRNSGVIVTKDLDVKLTANTVILIIKT